MSPIEVGVIILVAIFVLMALGVPVGVSLGITGAAAMWYLVSGSAAMVKLALVPYSIITSYDFALLPLFLLMAQICFTTGIVRDLFDLISKLLGPIRGGLAMTAVVACAVFGAISASGLATITTMGLVIIPEMKRHGYGPALLTGSIVCGATIDILIPPSAMFVYYGMLTETSIGKLFIAGIVPGLILTAIYCAIIYIWCRVRPDAGPPGDPSNMREKLVGLTKCGEIIVLIFLVLGGLMLGWFTPTEAGAVGAAGAILVSLVRKRLSFKQFKDAISETIKNTGMIYTLLIGVMIFSPAMAMTTIPQWIINTVVLLNLSPMLVMIIIIVAYLILGTFMDESTMMFLSIPIIFPLVFSLGFDPVWFGVMVVLLQITAVISPPMGINQFVVFKIAKDIPLTTIYKGTIPFAIGNIAIIFLILFVPSVALVLPGLMR
jgi:C4-dicarboxylate transporter, DctM subunit